MLKFDLVNTAIKNGAKNILFYGEGVVNVMDFIFSTEDTYDNKSDNSSNASTTLKPGDAIILISPAGLLSNPASVQMKADANLSFAYTQDKSGRDLFTLTVKNQLTISKLSNYTVELSNLAPSNQLPPAAFNSQYILQQRKESGYTAQFSILNKPNGADLRSVLNFTASINDNQPENQPGVEEGYIYLSDDNFDPPIANTIHLNLNYNGMGPLVSSDSDDHKAVFTLYFSCGTGNSALTDAVQPPPKSDQGTNDSGSSNPGDDDKNQSGDTEPYNAFSSAWNIVLEIAGEQQSYWNVEKPVLPASADDTSAYPVWQITPGTNNNAL